jgi:hypothetical protein
MLEHFIKNHKISIIRNHTQIILIRSLRHVHNSIFLDSFHLSAGEITMTLDNVSCLFHLPIKGCLLDHTANLARDEGVMLMGALPRVNPGDANI